MKTICSLMLLCSMIVASSLTWAEGVDGSGRPRSQTASSGRIAPRELLHAPALTLEDVRQLKTVGELLLSEQDSNFPYIINGVRMEFLSARDIINQKLLSAKAYGIKVSLKYPSQTCADRMCAVMVYRGPLVTAPWDKKD